MIRCFLLLIFCSVWSEWIIVNNTFQAMLFANGDMCPGEKPRQTKVWRKGVVSTVVLRQWGSSTRKFGFVYWVNINLATAKVFKKLWQRVDAWNVSFFYLCGGQIALLNHLVKSNSQSMKSPIPQNENKIHQLVVNHSTFFKYLCLLRSVGIEPNCWWGGCNFRHPDQTIDQYVKIIG